MEGVWVLGGVERTPDRKVFLVTVERRNRAVLERVVSRFIKHGSIIHTDCWAAYNGLGELDLEFEHRTVYHSIGFSIDGIHTNTIEGN